MGVFKTTTKKRLKSTIILALIILFACFSVGCGHHKNDNAADTSAKATTETVTENTTEAAAETEPVSQIDEYGEYTNHEDVALYIHTFKHLPDNYITKAEAESMGWHGGNPTDVCNGKSIGGDRFGNWEGSLPKGESYFECDVNYSDDSRGPERLVFTKKGAVYYTPDHYDSFELLYEEE